MKVIFMILVWTYSFALFANPLTELSAVIGENPVRLIEEKEQTTIETRIPKEVLKIDKCSSSLIKNFWGSLHAHLKRRNSIDINGHPQMLYKYRLNGKEYSTTNKSVWGAYLITLPGKADLLVNTVRRVCKK